MKKTLLTVLAFSVVLVLPVPGFSRETVTLSALITSAKQNNAEIIAARERWNASRARITQAKTWDNPKLNLEYWSIPEGSLDIGAATEKMYGVSQMIPFPGKLSLKGRIAGSEADAMQWEYKDTGLKVVSELKSAYAMYYYLNKSIETYRQTAEIMTDFSKVAEARYVVGQSAQGDVLRAQVEAEKMSTMVITLEQEKQTVQTEINRLIGKDSEEKLGEPEDIAPRFTDLKWDELKTAAVKNNPEIGKVSAAIEKGKWSKKSAMAEYLPDFDIAFRRKTMDGQWAGGDFMAGISVPLWFWKQSAGVQEMSASLAAAESDKKNTELMVIAKVKESFTKLEATRRLIELYSAGVIPKSEQSLKVTQASFTAGRAGFLELLDSVRSYLEFKLEYYKYVSEYQKDMAMLEKAVGTELTDGGIK
jgi:outer membrane protein TolC